MEKNQLSVNRLIDEIAVKLVIIDVIFMFGFACKTIFSTQEISFDDFEHLFG